MYHFYFIHSVVYETLCLRAVIRDSARSNWSTSRPICRLIAFIYIFIHFDLFEVVANVTLLPSSLGYERHGCPPLSFTAYSVLLTRGKFSRSVEGGEDYPGNINRYRRRKGARPILDIKPSVLTSLPLSSIPRGTIRLIEHVRRRRRRVASHLDVAVPPPPPLLLQISLYRFYIHDHRIYTALFRMAFIASVSLTYVPDTTHLYSVAFVAFVCRSASWREYKALCASADKRDTKDSRRSRRSSTRTRIYAWILCCTYSESSE